MLVGYVLVKESFNRVLDLDRVQTILATKKKKNSTVNILLKK